MCFSYFSEPKNSSLQNYAFFSFLCCTSAYGNICSWFFFFLQLGNETYVSQVVYKSLARQQISISAQQLLPSSPSLSSRHAQDIYTASLTSLPPRATGHRSCSPFRQWSGSAYPVPPSQITNDTRSHIALAWLAAPGDERRYVSPGAAPCLGRTPEAARRPPRRRGSPRRSCRCGGRWFCVPVRGGAPIRSVVPD